jgi:hypothetical protein
MVRERFARVDEHVVVACPLHEALSCLDGPTAIAAWFGGRRDGSRTTIASGAGVLVLERAHEEWLPEDGALLVVGTTGDLWFRAHLTLRAVMRPGAHPYLHPGTEIWTHVELGPADRAIQAVRVVQDVLRHGLDHLRLELDAS